MTSTPEEGATFEAEGMSEEKPLHVRVAEALGCKPWHGTTGGGDWYECRCATTHGEYPTTGPQPHGQHYSTGFLVLRYDTDWSATGPLIEGYALSVAPRRLVKGHKRDWQALSWRLEIAGGAVGPTPLIAVCNLLVALAEKGAWKA